MNGTVETTSRPEVASKTSEKKEKSSFKPFEKKTRKQLFQNEREMIFFYFEICDIIREIGFAKTLLRCWQLWLSHKMCWKDVARRTSWCDWPKLLIIAKRIVLSHGGKESVTTRHSCTKYTPPKTALWWRQYSVCVIWYRQVPVF